MQVTKELKQKAVKIARENKVKELWVNKSGEFFTSENLASISVDGKKEDYVKIDASIFVIDERTTNNDLPSKVDELIALIKAAETKEMVQAILDSENRDKKRKTVVDAATAKLTTF